MLTHHFTDLWKWKILLLCPPASTRSCECLPHSLFHAIIRTNIWNTNILYFSGCSLLFLSCHSCHSPALTIKTLSPYWKINVLIFFFFFTQGFGLSISAQEILVLNCFVTCGCIVLRAASRSFSWVCAPTCSLLIYIFVSLSPGKQTSLH